MYANDALFGDTPNMSLLPADALNPGASGPADWNAVITGGIQGAANAAIRNMVNGAYQSGQLINDQPGVTVRASQSGVNLLILAAVAYFILHG